MPKLPPASPPHNHDEFFRFAFGECRRARILLEGLLPPELLKALDLEHLSSESAEFLSEELRSSSADLVFRCPLVGGHRDVLSVILMEHKSEPPRHPHLQILRYMLSLWSTDDAAHRPLRPILPILFYHGKRRWKYRGLHDSFPGLPDFFRPFLPHFEYVLFDTRQLSDVAISERFGGKEVGLVLDALKYIWWPEKMEAVIERAEPDSSVDAGQSVVFLKAVLAYILGMVGLDKARLLQRKLHPTTRGLAMTTLQSTLEQGFQQGVQLGREAGHQEGLKEGLKEGRQEGRQEGVELGLRLGAIETAKRMLEAGFEPAVIAKMTELSPEKYMESTVNGA